MSNGKQKPTPPKTRTRTVVREVAGHKTTFDKWLDRAIPIVAMLVIGWLVSTKKIDQATADKLLPLITMRQMDDGSVEKTTVERTAPTVAAPAAPVVAAKPKPVAKPEDDADDELRPRTVRGTSMIIPPEVVAAFKQQGAKEYAEKHPSVVHAFDQKNQEWIDILLPIVIDWWTKPRPDPIPPAPIPPQPVPPNPVPPGPVPPLPPKPDPSPGGLKILIHDKTNTPITATTIDSLKWFRVFASGAVGVVTWEIETGGSPEIGLSGDGREYTGFLHDGDYVTFIAIDYEGHTKTKQRVTANHNSIPPPNPQPVDPVVPVPPAPQPPTPIPADVFGLTKASHDGKLAVTSANRSQEAKFIATVHRDAAKKAKANPFSLIGAMQSDVTTGLTNAMTPEAMAAWKPWKTSVAARIAALQVSGMLVDRQNWIDAFLEISDGLEIEP